MYKFVIPDTKRRKKVFFKIFWNISLVLMALTNLLLKPKCMLKSIFEFFMFYVYIKKTIWFFFVVWKYDVMIILIFERLGRMHEKQNIFFVL